MNETQNGQAGAPAPLVAHFGQEISREVEIRFPAAAPEEFSPADLAKIRRVARAACCAGRPWKGRLAGGYPFTCHPGPEEGWGWDTGFLSYAGNDEDEEDPDDLADLADDDDDDQGAPLVFCPPPRGESLDANAKANLLRHAAQGVLAAWEDGDLAGAVRHLAHVLEGDHV